MYHTSCTENNLDKDFDCCGLPIAMTGVIPGIAKTLLSGLMYVHIQTMHTKDPNPYACFLAPKKGKA